MLKTDALFAILPFGICFAINPAKGIHLAFCHLLITLHDYWSITLNVQYVNAL